MCYPFLRDTHKTSAKMRDAIYPKQSDVSSNGESIQDDMSVRQVQGMDRDCSSISNDWGLYKNRNSYVRTLEIVDRAIWLWFFLTIVLEFVKCLQNLHTNKLLLVIFYFNFLDSRE